MLTNQFDVMARFKKYNNENLPNGMGSNLPNGIEIQEIIEWALHDNVCLKDTYQPESWKTIFMITTLIKLEQRKMSVYSLG